MSKPYISSLAAAIDPRISLLEAIGKRELATSTEIVFRREQLLAFELIHPLSEPLNKGLTAIMGHINIIADGFKFNQSKPLNLPNAYKDNYFDYLGQIIEQRYLGKNPQSWLDIATSFNPDTDLEFMEQKAHELRNSLTVGLFLLGTLFKGGNSPVELFLGQPGREINPEQERLLIESSVAYKYKQKANTLTSPVLMPFIIGEMSSWELAQRLVSLGIAGAVSSQDINVSDPKFTSLLSLYWQKRGAITAPDVAKLPIEARYDYTFINHIPLNITFLTNTTIELAKSAALIYKNDDFLPRLEEIGAELASTYSPPNTEHIYRSSHELIDYLSSNLEKLSPQLRSRGLTREQFIDGIARVGVGHRVPKPIRDYFVRQLSNDVEPTIGFPTHRLNLEEIAKELPQYSNIQPSEDEEENEAANRSIQMQLANWWSGMRTQLFFSLALLSDNIPPVFVTRTMGTEVREYVNFQIPNHKPFFMLMSRELRVLRTKILFGDYSGKELLWDLIKNRNKSILALGSKEDLTEKSLRNLQGNNRNPSSPDETLATDFQLPATSSDHLTLSYRDIDFDWYEDDQHLSESEQLQSLIVQIVAQPSITDFERELALSALFMLKKGTTKEVERFDDILQSLPPSTAKEFLLVKITKYKEFRNQIMFDLFVDEFNGIDIEPRLATLLNAAYYQYQGTYKLRL